MTTILVVDDREECRREMDAKLSKRGFAVAVAQNGREAIEICRQGGIDAVLMDMNMPELDGCDATEQLKSIEETKQIPVIMCTAFAIDGDRERAEQCGSDAYVEKPIALKTLLAVLGKVLRVDYEAASPTDDESADVKLDSPSTSPR